MIISRKSLHVDTFATVSYKLCFIKKKKRIDERKGRDFKKYIAGVYGKLIRSSENEIFRHRSKSTTSLFLLPSATIGKIGLPVSSVDRIK